MVKIHEQPSQQGTARDVFFVLFKHKTTIILFFLAVVGLAALISFLSPRAYQSDAKLFIRLGRESVTLDPIASSGQVISVSQSFANQVNSEIEILKSREVARQVIDNIGLEVFDRSSSHYQGRERSALDSIRQGFQTVVAFPKKVVGNIMRPPDQSGTADEATSKYEKQVLTVTQSLEAEAVEDSNIIAISYKAWDPKLARDVLQEIINVFLHKHLEIHRSPGSFKFFQEQTNQLQADLVRTEKELKELKNEVGLVSFEEQRTILSDQVGALQTELGSVLSSVASSKARIEDLTAQLAELPEKVVTTEIIGSPDSAAEEMHKRISELKLSEQELLSTYTETSIPVQEVRRQIREAQNLLQQIQQNRQVTMGTSVTHQELKVALLLERGNHASLQAKAASLRGQLDQTRQELQRLNEVETRLVQLQRKKNLYEQNYAKYAESLEQTRIDQALETRKISNVSIAQAPAVPLEPVSPKTGLNIGLGLFFGIFGGLGMPFFMEYFSTSIQRPEQVEEVLELPVLGSIEDWKK
jgi:uncharacterized protein involved in exopolysaccharide biosynthesis